MLLTPLNYIFPAELVPIYEWEPVENPSDHAPPPAPLQQSSCDGSDPSAAPADAEQPTTELRLVLKGYEWRLVPERAVFSREDWESVYRSEADAKDEERDPASREAARHRPPPHAKPAQGAPTGLHPEGPSTDKTDSSES